MDSIFKIMNIEKGFPFFYIHYFFYTKKENKTHRSELERTTIENIIFEQLSNVEPELNN